MSALQVYLTIILKAIIMKVKMLQTFRIIV